jgi:hypothetical protein
MPIKFNPQWPRKVVNNLIAEIIGACIPDHADYVVQETGDTSALIKLRLPKYLQMQMGDPSFSEAFSTVVRAAGMSQGCSIQTESIWD